RVLFRSHDEPRGAAAEVECAAQRDRVLGRGDEVLGAEQVLRLAAHRAAAAAVEAEVRLQVIARGEEAAAGAAGDLEADAEVARRRRLDQRAREAELRGRRGAGRLEAAARPRPPARPHEPALEDRLAQVRRLDEPGRARGRPDDAGLERREPGRVAELVDARGRARAEVAAEVERAALQLEALRRVAER